MISKAFATAFRTVSAQKKETVKFLLAEAALTAMCLAPLLFLTEEGPVKYLAALALPLWLGVKVPARLNAAAAMQDALGEGRVFSLRLADPGGYVRKVLYGLKRVALLVLWGSPLIAALLYAWEQYSGKTDGLTVMDMIYTFGGEDMKTGIIYLLWIFAGLVLLLALGAGFHSGDRHAFALEKRGLGRKRFGILLCRICSLVFLAPLIAAVIITVMRYIPLLNDVSGVLSGDVPRPSTRTTLLILGIGAALTLPLLPLRSMVTAAYVREAAGGAADANAAGSAGAV